MRQLKIEWKHLEVDGKTCRRCGETGQILSGAIAELSKELQPAGVAVSFSETILSDRQVAESNTILLNGVPVEAILSEEVKVSENHCPSCSSLTGKETSCKTVERGGEVYEAIPDSLIRKAALKLFGLE